MQTEHTIEIKKIISGGSGLGHLEDGMVVMVPFVLPGDQVKVSEIKRFSGHIQAEILQIEQPGPKRRPPLCPQYGTCGGCALQHTPYANQLAIKKDILTEILTRGQVLPEEEIPDPVPSPHPLGYRCKIRLHIAKNGTIGFHKMQSHEVVETTACPLAAPALNNVLHRLHQSALLPGLAESCNQMELVCSPADDTVVATVYQTAAKRPQQQLLNQLVELSGLQGLALKSRKKTIFFPKPLFLQQRFSIHSSRYTLSWDSRCFFQVNPKQNEKLVQLVLAAAGSVADQKILDLFCGMGNFSIPLALAEAEVTGIELNKHSIIAAKENARKAGIQDIDFVQGNVDRYLQQLYSKKIFFDMVLLDPPRQGLGRTTKLLALLEAKKILYISCDPATLARDLKTLINAGYRFTSVTPVDMFPQTHHIECLAVLEKN